MRLLVAAQYPSVHLPSEFSRDLVYGWFEPVISSPWHDSSLLPCVCPHLTLPDSPSFFLYVQVSCSTGPAPHFWMLPLRADVCTHIILLCLPPSVFPSLAQPTSSSPALLLLSSLSSGVDLRFGSFAFSLEVLALSLPGLSSRMFLLQIQSQTPTPEFNLWLMSSAFEMRAADSQAAGSPCHRG